MLLKPNRVDYYSFVINSLCTRGVPHCGVLLLALMRFTAQYQNFVAKEKRYMILTSINAIIKLRSQSTSQIFKKFNAEANWIALLIPRKTEFSLESNTFVNYHMLLQGRNKSECVTN